MSEAKSAYHFTAIYSQKQVVSISLSQKVHIGTLQGSLFSAFVGQLGHAVPC